MILTTLNRNEIWRGHPIQTAVVFDTCGVLDDVQERCGESIFISWDFDENSSDVINVFVTFVPPKKPIYNPEDEDDEDRDERRHEHDTSW